MATDQLSPAGRYGASLCGAFLIVGCLASLGVYGLRHSPVLQGFEGSDVAGLGHNLAAPEATGPGEQLSGREALEKQVELLRAGEARLNQCPQYTCTLQMRERVNGELQGQDEVRMAIRHEPFSVSLKWPDGTQHAVYVEGENDNQMLVSFGGWKRILGRLKLDPHGDRAMSHARYPITEAGLLKLTERLLEYRERDLGLSEGVACTMEADEMIEGRDCHRFVVEYQSPQVEPIYRKSIIHVDKSLSLPISVVNYTWSDSESDRDEDMLIERYIYRDLQLDTEVADTEFEVDPRRRAG